jgi:ABC-type transporter Mla MlaB component
MDAWSVSRPVRELRPGDHAWLEYGSAEENDYVVEAFVRAGVRARRLVICVEESGFPGLDGAGPGAGVRVLDLARAGFRRGRFDPELLYHALCREVREGEDAGLTPVRVTLDLSRVLREPGGFELLLECERLFTGALGTCSTVIALCRFDRRSCPPAELAALRALHAPMACADPEYEDAVLRLTRVFQPPGLAVHGEIDASRHEALERALRAVGDGRRELRLDLTELRFIDFGGLRVLGEAARERTLVLDRVPAQLRTVMEIVGWDALPGLQIGDAGAMAP